MGCTCSDKPKNIIKGNVISAKNLHALAHRIENHGILDNIKRNYFFATSKRQWLLILDFLNFKELVQVSQCNKLLKDYSKNHHLLKKFFKNRMEYSVLHNSVKSLKDKEKDTTINDKSKKDRQMQTQMPIPATYDSFSSARQQENILILNCNLSSQIKNNFPSKNQSQTADLKSIPTFCQDEGNNSNCTEISHGSLVITPTMKKSNPEMNYMRMNISPNWDGFPLIPKKLTTQGRIDGGTVRYSNQAQPFGNWTSRSGEDTPSFSEESNSNRNSRLQQSEDNVGKSIVNITHITTININPIIDSTLAPSSQLPVPWDAYNIQKYQSTTNISGFNLKHSTSKDCGSTKVRRRHSCHHMKRKHKT